MVCTGFVWISRYGIEGGGWQGLELEEIIVCEKSGL